MFTFILQRIYALRVCNAYASAISNERNSLAKCWLTGLADDASPLNTSLVFLSESAMISASVFLLRSSCDWSGFKSLI